MKPILTSIMLFAVMHVSAQRPDYIIRVEIDNSTKYAYDIAYSKAKSDYYRKETADIIKMHADNFFTTLNRNVDYLNEQKLNSDEMRSEIMRLKYLGEDIMLLLPMMDSGELTGTKIKHTIEKANSELDYSMNNRNGNAVKIMYKNIILQQFGNDSDDVLVAAIKMETGESTESILNYCKDKVLHDCLLMRLVEVKK